MSLTAYPSGAPIGINTTGIVGLVDTWLGPNSIGPARFTQPWIDVKAYGATGNGLTDDTAAINLAIAAIPVSGGTLYFPDGTYLISSTLTLPKNNFAMVGSNRGSCQIVGAVTFTTGDMVTLQSGGDYVTIRDIMFTMSGATVRTSGNTINTNGCSDVTIHDVTIFYPYIGINVTGGSSKVYINNIDIKVPTPLTTSINSSGIQVNNGSTGDTYIGPHVNIESASGATRSNYGINVLATGYTQLTEVAATASAAGLAIQPGAGITVLNIFASKCLFDTCNSQGMVLNAGTSTSVIRQARFTDCWFSGTVAGPGIFSEGVAGGVIDDIAFVNCRILSNNQQGVNHTFGTNFLWDANTIAGNSTAGASSFDAILVAAAVSSFTITNNLICNVNTFGTNQQYGVNITAGASNHYTICNNNLNGNNKGPLSDNGTATDKCIGGNLGSFPIIGAISTNTANVAVTTTTPTEIVFGNIPAYALQVGTTLKIKAWGQCVSTGTTAGSINFRLGTANTNADTLVATIAQTPTSATSEFRIEFLVTIRSTGAGGTAIGQGILLNSAATGYASVVQTFAVQTATVAVNTTVANFLSLWITTGAATVVPTFFIAEVNVIRP